MPNKNGTGPKGQGPRTGHGAGNCNGQGGNGHGAGRGAGGSGRGAGSNNTQGKSLVQNQVNDLQIAIQKLTERLDGTKNE